jgi:hypothetical protein
VPTIKAGGKNVPGTHQNITRKICFDDETLSFGVKFRLMNFTYYDGAMQSNHRCLASSSVFGRREEMMHFMCAL